MQAQLNHTVPDLTFESTQADISNFKSLRGKKVVLYFYPKDNTPGCTTEANDFKAAHKQLLKLNAVVIGVSRDSIKTHQNFIKKFDLPFALISDKDETICRCFDIIQLKKLYGREYMGIVRSTFILDEDGKVCHEWRGVKVKGHVDKVIATLSK